MTAIFIWSAITLALVVLALMRDGNGRAFVPWSFPVLAGVVTLIAIFWSDVHASWLVMLLFVAAIIVAFARFGVAMVAVVGAAALAFGPAIVASATNSGDDAPSVAASATPTHATTPTDNSSDTSSEPAKAPKSLNEEKLAKAIAADLADQGFKSGQVKVGNKVDWTKNPVENRGGAFAGRIESQKELTEFLNGNSSRSRAARQHVIKAVPKSEHSRVLNGENYVPVQYLVPTVYSGNTYVTKSGNVVRGGSNTAKSGDVVWAYVSSDYKVMWDSSVRADCANPGYTKPPRPAPKPVKVTKQVPAKPTTTPTKPHKPPKKTPPPATPPPTTPPATTPPPTTPPTLTPKDPKDDPKPPKGVTPLPQLDPVEKTPPVVKKPIDTSKEPGSSAPDVPAPGSKPVDKPKPPKDDSPPSPPPVTDKPNTSDKEDPGTEITDPDASLLLPILPILVGLARLRKK